MTLREALLALREPLLVEYHHLQGYADAYADYVPEVLEFVGGGRDSLAFLREDGLVLKLTTRDLPSPRPFDLPVLERGSRGPIAFYVQPRARRASGRHLMELGEEIRACGYHFVEPFVQQVGLYRGRPWLLDPFSVVPAPKTPRPGCD